MLADARRTLAERTHPGGEMTEDMTPQGFDGSDALDRTAPRAVRRWVAMGVVVSMATGVLGFLAGRASVPDADTLVTAGAETEVADTAPAADVAVTPSTTGRLEVSVVQGSEDTVAPAGGNDAAAFEGDQLGAYPEAPMNTIVERTTADGILIRVLGMDQPALDGEYGYPGGWVPAAWCFPNGSVRIELVTATAAQVGWGSRYSDDAEFPKAQTFAGGYPQNTPFYGISIQVDPSAVTARFTANGATDETAVVDGVAVLAVPGPIDRAFELTLIDATGAADSFGEADLSMQTPSDRYLAECTPPPPALPDAGEQPSDPSAARAAVEASFDGAYARDGTGLQYIDDPTGVQEARDKVGESTYAETAANAELTIDELVFTSPTEAWFRYSIRADVSSFANRYGIARLGDDGVWRITRATVCQDLALIPDGGCDPAVESIMPPSGMVVIED